MKALAVKSAMAVSRRKISALNFTRALSQSSWLFFFRVIFTSCMEKVFRLFGRIEFMKDAL